MADINNFLALMLQLSVPIVLGALCGTIAERGGVILLGVEGLMLIGAFAGVAGSFFTGSAFAGVIASVLAGALVGWIYALFCLKWKAQQSVVGVGINLFASGITAVMLKAIWHTEGMSDPVEAISTVTVPVLSKIPVNRYRYIAMMAAGAIAGLAGSYLSLAQNNLFVTDMVSGRGFMGLAANIFGGWHPVGSLGAGMVFAVAQAARFYLTDFEIPSQIVQMLPYVITLLILLFVGKRVKGPEALGKLVD